MDFRKLTKRAKQVIDQRGGTEALKKDAEELREIAKGKGTLQDKAKRAAEALKEPGTRPAPDAGEPTGRAPADAPEPQPGAHPPP
ncbi:MAG TPA: hypothetical protein VD931_22400 [Baekduia sp.]|nr:hypothetical protein [Baekduia sp.]